MAKTLFVIGNGFDLMHGFRTKLSDFKEYLENKDNSTKKFLYSLAEYIPLEKNWSNFEEALGKFDFDKLCSDESHLIVNPGSDDFRDCANHDYTYEISNATDFSSKIPFFLKEWISSIKIEGRPIFNIPYNNLFLSFNYTATLEKIYHIPNNNILYIHGSCVSKKELICGHNNKVELQRKKYDISCSSSFEEDTENVRQSYFKNTYKNTEKHIEEHIDFFNNLHEITEIVILGHSFQTNIDDAYFLKIKEMVSEDCIWKISYHSCEDCQCNQCFVNTFQISNYIFFRMWQLNSVLNCMNT